MTKPLTEWDPAFFRPPHRPISHSSWITKVEKAHDFFSVDWADETLESIELDQLPTVVATRLEQVLHWHRLEDRVAELAERVDRLEEALETTESSIAIIQTFAPEKYTLLKPISVMISSNGGSAIASFFDANISTEGDNEQEAFENLKSLILDTFDSLSREASAELGPEPQRQLAVLRSFISAT